MLAGLVTFRRSELALARGLRGAAAVVLPLVVGAATGHLQYGGDMAPRAPPPRLASFFRETRTPPAGVLLSSPWIGAAGRRPPPPPRPAPPRPPSPRAPPA